MIITEDMYLDLWESGTLCVKKKYGLTQRQVNSMKKNSPDFHQMPDGYALIQRLDRLCDTAEKIITDEIGKDEDKRDLIIVVRAMKAVSDLSKTMFIGVDVAEKINQNRKVDSELEFEQIMKVVREVLTPYPAISLKIANALESPELANKVDPDRLEKAINYLPAGNL